MTLAGMALLVATLSFRSCQKPMLMSDELGPPETLPLPAPQFPLPAAPMCQEEKDEIAATQADIDDLRRQIRYGLDIRDELEAKNRALTNQLWDQRSVIIALRSDISHDNWLSELNEVWLASEIRIHTEAWNAFTASGGLCSAVGEGRIPTHPAHQLPLCRDL